MRKFNLFGLLFPISLSSPIFDFIGDLIDNGKKVSITLKGAKWVDIHQFDKRNKQDLGMTPGQLGKVWISGKVGDVYQDSYFEVASGLRAVTSESNPGLASFFVSGIGYRVKEENGQVLNVSGIQGLKNGKQVESQEVKVPWSEIRRVGAAKKLERTVKLDRVSFARISDSTTVVPGCELRIRGDMKSKWEELAMPEGVIEPSQQNRGKWSIKGYGSNTQYLDLYLIFVLIKASKEITGAETLNKIGRSFLTFGDRNETCTKLGKVGQNFSVQAVEIENGQYINVVESSGQGSYTDGILALAGVGINTWGGGVDRNNISGCLGKRKQEEGGSECPQLKNKIGELISVTKKGDRKVDIDLMDKPKNGTDHWYNDRQKKVIWDGFKPHQDLKFTMTQGTVEGW